MKTFKINTFNVMTKALLTVAIFAFFSCSNTKKDSTESPNQSEVSTPSIDLHTAVISDNIEAVKQHILAGSDLNEKDPFGGSSPLITAALFGKVEIAKILIDAGADLNFKNNEGSTALHTAAFFCRTEMVKMLLDKGIDKSIRNNFGATAFESVAGPYSDVKSIYEVMSKQLSPMGLVVDFAQIEKTRPTIAEMLL